jgi:endonuclease-8
VPEGDTVWRTARNLSAALAGAPLVRTDFRLPALATLDLSGRQVLEVVSRGKHLLVRVDPDVSLHSHLRMDGSWHLYREGSRWSGGPGHEIRVVLATASWAAVGYRLHDVALVATSREAELVGHLGPDLLGPDWDPAEAERRLRQDPLRPVGEALLDQRALAGIGNVYKAETLFLSGVSPWRPVGEVASLDRVVERAHRLLSANRERTTQTTTGDTRRGRQHWVYDRAGRPCLRCGTMIRSAEQGDPLYERVAYWCPSCQPGPGPDA